MKRPKSDRPLTVDNASNWINYYNWCIDILQNHCEITNDDTCEIAIFKLYAKIQKIEDTYKELKRLYPSVAYKTSKELTEVLKKSHIPDTELEEFVKYLVTTASSYTQRKR